jgi:hypothetical protein
VRDATGAVPVPVSVTLCGELVAESVRFKLAVREDPSATGAKVTVMVQVPGAARVLPQVVLVTEKSLLLAPVIVVAVMVKLPFPVLLKVKGSEALDPTATLVVKVSGEGDRPTIGPVPVPVKVTLCTVPATSLLLSVRLKVAVRVPVPVGVNVTLMLQLFPAATEVPQLLLWTKSPAFVPVIPGALLRVKGTFP